MLKENKMDIRLPICLKDIVIEYLAEHPCCEEIRVNAHPRVRPDYARIQRTFRSFTVELLEWQDIPEGYGGCITERFDKKPCVTKRYFSHNVPQESTFGLWHPRFPESEGLKLTSAIDNILDDSD